MRIWEEGLWAPCTGDPPMSIAAWSGNLSSSSMIKFGRARVALRVPIRIPTPGIAFPIHGIGLPAQGRPASGNQRHIFPLHFPRWNSLESRMGRPYIIRPIRVHPLLSVFICVAYFPASNLHFFP